MATDVIHYLAPHLRGHPDAAAFAAVIDTCLPEGWGPDSFGQRYAWEADIPPRSEWGRHAEELTAHILETFDCQECGGTRWRAEGDGPDWITYPCPACTGEG